MSDSLNHKPSPLKRHCPICHCKKGHVLLELSYALFDDNPMPRETNVVYCMDCGLLFYDTPATEADLHEFYSHHYQIPSYEFRANYPPEIFYLKQMAGFVKDLGLLENAKIIDVGCGPGHLLKFIQAEGYYNLLGIELRQDYIEKLKKDGLNAVCGSAISLPDESKGAECFIYKWTFEHLLDLHKAMRSLTEKICDGGFVIVEVPDAISYDIFDNYIPLNYFIIEHINHFSLHHLSALFELYGFEIVRSHHRLNDQHEIYPFPQICMIFCYRPEAQKKPKITPDFSLAKKASKWFETASFFERSDLEKISENSVPVHVWGLSYRTLMHLKMGPLMQCNIAGYYDIDPEKQKKKIDGKSISSPDMLSKVPDNAVIVVGVGPSYLFMKKHLRSIGFKGKIIVLQK